MKTRNVIVGLFVGWILTTIFFTWMINLDSRHNVKIWEQFYYQGVMVVELAKCFLKMF